MNDNYTITIIVYDDRKEQEKSVRLHVFGVDAAYAVYSQSRDFCEMTNDHVRIILKDAETNVCIDAWEIIERSVRPIDKNRQEMDELYEETRRMCYPD